MKKRLSALLFLLLCLSCGPNTSHLQPGKPELWVSNSIVWSSLNEIFAPHFRVRSLLPHGIDPHSYRARPSNFSGIIGAQLLVAHGPALEGKLYTMFKGASKNKPVYFIENYVPDSAWITTATGLRDPHIWFNVALWTNCITAICESIGNEQLAHSDSAWRNNLRQWQEKNRQLDSLILAQSMQLPANNRLLLTEHNAFSYFGKQYDWQVRALRGTSTQSDFGLFHLQKTATWMFEHQVPALFYEHANPDNGVKALAEVAAKKGYPLHFLGPLATDAILKPEDRYSDFILYNVNLILQKDLSIYDHQTSH
jgi:manganese/zinc/iron transport system substrate-binding protein